MVFWDFITRAIKSFGPVSVSQPLPSVYTNPTMRNLPKLNQAILRAYERPEYKPKIANGKIVETYCNAAARDVAGYMGCHDFSGLNADAQCKVMRESKDWREVQIKDAQYMANQGSLVFAALSSNELMETHGHICVIRPGEMIWSSHWNMEVPSCMNVGGQNFILWFKTGDGKLIEAGINGAFQKMPKFFTWVPSV